MEIIETQTPTEQTPVPAAAAEPPKPATKTLRPAHEELMREENIKFEDLPKDIRKKINGFNLQRKKLEKKYSENLFKNLQEMTVEIADLIESQVIEKDLPDEPPAPADPPPPPVETPEEKVAKIADLIESQVIEKDLPDEPPAPADPPPPPVETPEEKVAKIAEAIKAKQAKGVILRKDLEEILGRAPQEVETFANVKISKLAFSKHFAVY